MDNEYKLALNSQAVILRQCDGCEAYGRAGVREVTPYVEQNQGRPAQRKSLLY